MKKLVTLLVMFSVCASVYGQQVIKPPFTPDSGTLVVRCGVLIDGIGHEAQRDKTVVIIDGRISAVSDDGIDTPGATLDLSDHTCLPGLIDTHTHITDNAGETRDLSVYYTRSEAEERAISSDNSRITLLAGITSVRNVGAYGAWSGRDVRDRINRGEIIGPRVQTSGFYLTIPGGGGDLVIPGIDESEIPARVRMGVARGPDEFRQKAQLAVDGGADLLKIIASGAVLAYGGVPGSPEMTFDEIKAVVEVGHAAGIKVVSHAHGAQSIKDSIRAGADAIEHASLADDEAIAMAAEKQVPFSMDVYNGDYIASAGRENGWPEEFVRKNDETTEAQRQTFTKAHKAGVPILFGTDAAVYPHGQNARQFVIMVQRGMTPMEAIKAATSVAAESMGMGDDVGALAVGRYGDLIAVQGNPLADISALQQIKVVIKGGQLFKHEADAGVEMLIGDGGSLD